MTGDDTQIYDRETGQLETIWGEGFLSPGGPAEVSRILGSHSIKGCELLDIGSGSGGVDIVLVQEHGAGSVVGIDVDKNVVDLANRRLRAFNLEDKIKYQLVDPGPLPFHDDAFDMVFSKDAVIHIPDKRYLYSEVFRVVRAGGRLFVSDWLRGGGNEFDDTVERFVEASGHEFTVASLEEMGQVVEGLGFVEIELVDRREWYLMEATSELERMRGPLREQVHDQIEFWELMVDALNEGAIMPGHIRAKKPG